MTGLIYVAIVALWAAVLIPMWLRRHDDDQARRIERHRVAMGTLARIADEGEVAQGAAARRRRPEAALVVLSNYATDEMRSRCLASGADRVFDKSRDIDQLVAYCVALAERSPGELPH